MALENDTGRAPLMFTNEELQRIAALAEQNGVTLGESTLLALENGLDLPEWEVIREIAYESFGPEPMFWSLEEQYWFHQAMVELGVQKTNDHLLPGEGDLTEEEAVAKARAELLARTDSDVSFLDDPERCIPARSYQLAYDEAGNPAEKLWLIGFLDRTRGFFYQVLLSQDGSYLFSRMGEIKTINDSFSHEELSRIVALAEENGITLSDNIRKAIEKGEGYWEEEVIMSLAKSQFGPYPGQWTLEQQWWFEETMIAIGFHERNCCLIPREGDLTYEEAYAKAIDYLSAEGWVPDPALLDDRTKYSLWRSYQCVLPEDGGSGVPEWNFIFEPKDVDLPTLSVLMNQQGGLEGIGRMPGVAEQLAEGNLRSAEVKDRFTTVYGSLPGWTPEVFVRYVDVLRQTDLSQASKGIRAFAATQYCLPPEGALTPDQAIGIAMQAVPLEDVRIGGTYCFEVDGRVRWKVTLASGSQRISDMVELDALTGEILEVYQSEVGHAAELYVPRSVWLAIPEPSPDGLG